MATTASRASTATQTPGFWRRTLIVLLSTVALTATVTAVPQLDSPAAASVYTTCRVDGCADAVEARTEWYAIGLPTSKGWYAWPDGDYNYTGGRYQNRDGQLPSATYAEFDVYPRARKAARDAYRIVVNRSTGATWYSPDHYADFYRIA